MRQYDIISELEVKMIDFKHGKRKSKSEPPMLALNQEERELYADYLDSKNQPQGASVFRNYVEPLATSKDIKKRSKEAQTLKNDALSTYERLLLKPKESVASILYKKSQLDELNQDELKALLRFIEDYKITGNKKPDALLRSYRAQAIELITEKILWQK